MYGNVVCSGPQAVVATDVEVALELELVVDVALELGLVDEVLAVAEHAD